MKKIYIVTQGWYSDYRIKRVFSNKEKAEKYSKTIEEANEIEEYALDDSVIYDIYNHLTVVVDFDFNFEIIKKKYSIKKGTCILNNICFEFEKRNTLDYELESQQYLSYYAGIYTLCLHRPIKKENLSLEEKQEYMKKYFKVVVDIVAELKYAHNVEDVHAKKLPKWLQAKYETK